jgi:tRNA A-37 threonylcarbamoyl transferase component Bud32
MEQVASHRSVTYPIADVRLDESSAVGAALPELGELIGGRFCVEGVLGKGGMGAVYRVRDERSGQQLALKRLRIAEESNRALLTSLFEREYHTLVQLAHPRIIAVHDYGLDEQGAYYTMELLDGSDLRDRKRLPWQEACALLRDVASSLAILHSRRLLHRDLSPRNIRCTSDGRLKLIDFGAMAAMGVPKTLVGTPPFIPPEALQMQALDARADLYALGALGYWMLTAKHAYAARAIDELRGRWRRPPSTPQELEPSVPALLSQLVMELLQLDREARPASAAEVMERLSAIAGLPMEERPEVTQAYLATPHLVGREQALLDARAALWGLLRGKGATLVIEGASGTGRSRFLDACVLEAKLLGATVLRADAGDGGHGDYGAVQALCAQLFEALPGFAKTTAEPWKDVLAHVIDGLVSDAKGGAVPERRQVQTALRDWLLSVARVKRLVLAVDDVDWVDEPSAALLAALAHKSEGRGLAVVVTSELGSSSPALGLLREIGHRTLLAPLSTEQTEALIRSVFGNIDNVALVARWIHEVSEGHCRPAMELVQHLVDRQVARYQAGSWALPHSLDDGDLPRTLSAARAARVALLGVDARELGEALSLTDPALLSLQDYPALTVHGGHARTYRALDELLGTGILVAAAERYLFSQRSWTDLFSAPLSAERKRELHERLARVAAHARNPTRLARHLMEAGEVRGAIELLLQLRKNSVESCTPAALRLLEQAITQGEVLGMPLQTRLELCILLVGISSHFGDHQRFSRYAPVLLEQLKRDSGLDDWYALGDRLPPAERLGAAFNKTQQRYDATPEAERGFAPIDAIPKLARLCSSFSIMAAGANEPELVLSLPSLLPFAPLSPAIAVVEQMLEAMRHTLTSRTNSALALYCAVFDRLNQPDRAGLDELAHHMLRLGALRAIGSLEAVMGIPTAIERVAELEELPEHRANAWRIHRLAHMMQGNAEEAQRAQRRAELQELENGQPRPDNPALADLIVHVLAEHLLGVKQATERLAHDAEVYPGLRCVLQIARSHYRRLQGDYEGALKELAPVLRSAEHGVDNNWLMAVSAQVAALTALGRHQEAAIVALEYSAICARMGIIPRLLVRPVIEALARGGRVQEALELADASIADARAYKARGLGIGPLFEARARVALAMGDDAGFGAYAERCALEYRRGKSSTLSARYERLILEAQREGVTVSNHLIHAADWEASAPSTTEESSAHTIRSRLLECAEPKRALYTLTVLLEQTGAEIGHLYAWRGGLLERLVSLPGGDAPVGLAQVLERHLQRALESSEQATVVVRTKVAETSPPSESVTAWTDSEGHCYEPLVLATKRDGEPVIAAVAALSFGQRRCPPPSSLVLDLLASALVDHDDVDPVT